MIPNITVNGAKVPLDHPFDAFLGRPRRSCSREDQYHCAVTLPMHACNPAETEKRQCEAGSTAAPEANGLCVRAAEEYHCAPLTSKTHVYDVAAKAWLFPRIIELAAEGRRGHFVARAKLVALSANMTHPDPDARPSFSELLEMLDAP